MVMIMMLYYGSETLFEQPIYGVGKPYNDYGLGFYMATSFDLAKLWASKSINGGYVLTFSFEMNDLKVLNLEDYNEENVLKWISILVNHRFEFSSKERYKSRLDWLDKKFHINVEAYDVIIGYRADDSYFNYSMQFVSGDLSFEILTQAMRTGKLGLQYVAISEKAFSKLRYIGIEYIAHTNEYESFQKNALEEFTSLKKQDKETNTFIRDLIRKYGE